MAPADISCEYPSSSSIAPPMFVLLQILYLISLCVALYTLGHRAQRFYQLHRHNSMRRLFSVHHQWLIVLAFCVVACIALFIWSGQETDFPQPILYGLLGILLALEVWPSSVVMSWRRAIDRGQWIPVGSASALATVTVVQIGLIAMSIVVVCTALVRIF